MKCSICNSDLTDNDNYCHNCGTLTTVGYMYFKHNKEIDGKVFKLNRKFKNILLIFSISIILLTTFTFIKGNDILKPVFYLQKQINEKIYGYKISLIKTDNIYNNQKIYNIEDAYNIIKKDFDKQEFKCYKNNEVVRLEEELEFNYKITSVSFCDISYEEVKKIYNVITKMYNLFPNIEGYLTNITITNAKTQDEYIAYFEPKYEFVNINNYNKVNKTQILLNSYYYLNENILNKGIENNDYVKNANYESIIAHELGHYITFVTYLKENNIDNIVFITKDNESTINKLIENYDKEIFQENIVTIAYNNYINKYGYITIDNFINNISKYASIKTNNSYIYDEVIAESIHDYYLNGNNASKSSLEIVNVIKSKLGVL